MKRYAILSTDSDLTSLRDLELMAIENALDVMANKPKQEIAAALGIGRSTLYRKMDELGIGGER